MTEVLQKGDTFAGYTVRRVLGFGGMGTVYLARHPRLPRLTALKLLGRDLYSDTEIRKRFEREADLVAQLDHPNIVTVYDRGAEDDQLWISMQFVAGADASCVDVGVLPAARAVRIIADTAAALDFAHVNGVLHRDVKPANILLAKAPIGQPERVLLTDFGIASVRDADTTLGSAGSITATLAYAAPEHLAGDSLDHRGDQYSLACTLFWMLTGSAPYPGANPAAVINGHLNLPVPSARTARPDLPPAFDAVVMRALAKEPAERFDSCAAFAAAAQAALGAARSGPHRSVQPQGGPPTGYPGVPPYPPVQPYPSAQPRPGGRPYPTGQPRPYPQGPYPSAQPRPPYPQYPAPPRPHSNPPRPHPNARPQQGPPPYPGQSWGQPARPPAGPNQSAGPHHGAQPPSGANASRPHGNPGSGTHAGPQGPGHGGSFGVHLRPGTPTPSGNPGADPRQGAPGNQPPSGAHARPAAPGNQPPSGTHATPNHGQRSGAHPVAGRTPNPGAHEPVRPEDPTVIPAPPPPAGPAPRRRGRPATIDPPGGRVRPGGAETSGETPAGDG
ncbi:serine/threonine-protein kinase [Nocardia jiangsuensis]|uniref:non-specific serine/threonine protein kinase n=1 Tax=Nocardia jiangsuensis TaxID=1691563 RepID=A0ABV8DS67_9NOCA